MSKKIKIIVHCIVCNEERFIWYALNSVLPLVDQVFAWDTGSTDNTAKIIKSIKSKKIKFKQLSSVDKHGFTLVRQKMLDQTPKGFTWLMILDGDEIWPQKAIQTVTDFARKHPQYESIVVRTNNLVGDIYHRLPQSAGRYHLAGHTGHLALRLINLKVIPNLHVGLPHGQQGFFDKNNKLIQNRDPKKIKFIDLAYHHATHLQRSLSRSKDTQVPKRKQKLKYELGQKIPNTEMPRIFFAKHPLIVSNVTQRAGLEFQIKALLYTLPRRLKRLLLSLKSGY